MKTRRQFLGQASCASIGSLSILNTLLSLRLLQGVANADTPVTGEYRALVCLFLAGGNDSFNMLVPREASAYADYTTSRADLALSPAGLLEINPIGLPGYYVHGGMPEVASLFENGSASFVANVGTLIEPVQNRTEVLQNLKLLPLGLYSHSDQIEQWQTSIPHSRSGIGWGGRMADILRETNSNQVVPMQISLDGSNVFQTGNHVAEYSITPSGAVALSGYGAQWQQYADVRNAMSAAVDSQLAGHYNNLLAQTFTQQKKQALDAYETFAAATAPPLPSGITFPNTYIGSRLAMVARAIQGHGALGHTRQTFFVQRGGWDHHDEVLVNQGAMLPEVSEAIGAFHAAMVAMGLQDKVCLFTASDFGRTLTSNGRGSDHAWGGNQLVVGGGVQGRRIFGEYPSLAINPESGPELNPLDTGRGRFIPTTSCDLFFAELALWLGVSKSQLPPGPAEHRKLLQHHRQRPAARHARLRFSL
ncbi:MAG: DUF1501 domain-containing protein, partial [Verrucomicrobiae bacterium]|nr:DUF1501 domain-containing protein [Verrucomicrobiae bacterium]